MIADMVDHVLRDMPLVKVQARHIHTVREHCRAHSTVAAGMIIREVTRPYSAAAARAKVGGNPQAGLLLLPAHHLESAVRGHVRVDECRHWLVREHKCVPVRALSRCFDGPPSAQDYE